MIGLEEVREAARRLAGKLHRTPLLSSVSLGERAGVCLFLKCESFQKTGSFKPRGALNRILALDPATRRRGLVTVSAGNHAQAVAWSARLVGAPCAVVMPADAPRGKMEAVRSYGAEIIAHPDRATLFDKLREVEAERGLVFVHPFDDPMVLAGAGTAGLEILEDLPEADAVVVPVGGGGLLGGIACAVKAIRPVCRVVGVELREGPGLEPALAAGRPVSVSRPYGTVADGMTPPFVGALPLEIARRHVDEVVAVGEEQIVEAMRLLMTRAKLYVEGSGAASTAAVVAGAARFRAGSLVVAVVSGGNLDPDRAAAILRGGGDPC